MASSKMRKTNAALPTPLIYQVIFKNSSRAQSPSTPATAAAAAPYAHQQHPSISTQFACKRMRSYTMSQTNVSDRTHIFGKAPTNSLRERLRQLIHRAVILPIRFLKHVLRPGHKRLSEVLFDGSSDEPFCMNPPSPASTSSVQIEFSPPFTVRNPTFANTPIASAVISPSRLIHSHVLGSPISMQMDFGPLSPTVRNRTSRDLSLASTTTPSSSLPPVASPIFQENSSAFHASMPDTNREFRNMGETLAMQGCDDSSSFLPGASVQPTSTADNVLRAGRSRERAGTNQLPNSRADDADAPAQAERSSRDWQNTSQPFGPLTAQEFPEPLTHSVPGSRCPGRPDLRHASAHAAESQAEDPHEPHIRAQNIQPRPELSSVKDSSATPETIESLGMDTAEDVAEYLSHFEDLTNLDRWGKNAQERRRPLTTPSQELPNQISCQTPSSDTSEIMPSSLQVGTDSGFSEASAYLRAGEGPELFLQGTEAAASLTPTTPPLESSPPSIRNLLFESDPDDGLAGIVRKYGTKRLRGEVRATVSYLERITEFGPFSGGFEGEEWFDVKG